MDGAWSARGQEDQLSALGLVLNAVVLWNTRYIDAAITELRAQGHPVPDEHTARLSPLVDKHLTRPLQLHLRLPAAGPTPSQHQRPAAAVGEVSSG